MTSIQTVWAAVKASVRGEMMRVSARCKREAMDNIAHLEATVTSLTNRFETTHAKIDLRNLIQAKQALNQFSQAKKGSVPIEAVPI